MLLVMSAEQVRKLMPSEKLEDLLRLITSGIAERAKNGCYSQTVGCPEGIYSEELIAQAKEFLEKLGYKFYHYYTDYDMWFRVSWEEQND